MVEDYGHDSSKDVGLGAEEKEALDLNSEDERSQDEMALPSRDQPMTGEL